MSYIERASAQRNVDGLGRHLNSVQECAESRVDSTRIWEMAKAQFNVLIEQNGDCETKPLVLEKQFWGLSRVITDQTIEAMETQGRIIDAGVTKIEQRGPPPHPPTTPRPPSNLRFVPKSESENRVRKSESGVGYRILENAREVLQFGKQSISTDIELLRKGIADLAPTR